MTITEAILEIFKREKRPLTPKDVYTLIVKNNLYSFNSENPRHVVSTAIRRYTKELNFKSYKKFSSKINYFEESGRDSTNHMTYRFLDLDYQNLENLSIIELNQKFYNFLQEKRMTSRKKFYYIYRKGNYGGWLDLGHWFYGDDNTLLISFWNGMDWKNKAPNIRLRFSIKGQVNLEVSMSDSDEKRDFLLDKLNRLFNMDHDNGVSFKILEHNCNLDQMLNILDNFINHEKVLIDEIIDEFNFENKRLMNQNSISPIDSNDFYSRERKIKFYQQKLTDDISEKKLSFKKPSKIKSFNIKNYGPIINTTIDDISFNTQWIFITGENGSGKTNLLKALAITLGYKTLSRNEISKDFHTETELYSNQLLEDGIEVFNRSATNSETSYRRSKVIGLCMYGPYRLINSEKLSMEKFKLLFQKAGTFQSLFSDAAPLLDLEQQLTLWKSNKDHYIEKRLYFLRIILINIVPGLYDIRLDKNKPIKYIIRKDKNEKEIEAKWNELSSGTKSVFSLVVDIMLRLYEQQPKVIDPSELRGVVMIDEIDLHLHPSAQRELIITLSNVFQNVQFLVTTHSPIPLLGAPKNSQIYVMKNLNGDTKLERMDEKVYFSRLAPNALLSSPIFNFENLVPESKNKDEIPYVDETYDEVKYLESLNSNIDDFHTKKRKKELLELFSEEN